MLCPDNTLGCARRYAYGSLDKSFVSKLKCAYCEVLGMQDGWSPDEQRDYPVNSTLVSSYMSFTTAEQLKGGGVLCVRRCLCCGQIVNAWSKGLGLVRVVSSDSERMAWVRDIALFTVAFRTAGRVGDLHCVLGGRVLKLP